MSFKKQRVNIDLGIAIGDTVNIVIPIKDVNTGLPVDLSTYGVLEMTVYDSDEPTAVTLIATKSNLTYQDVDGTNDGLIYPLLRADTVSGGADTVSAGRKFYEARDVTAARRIAWGDFVLQPSPDVG